MTVDNPVIKCESVFKIFGSNPEKMLEKKSGYVDAKNLQEAGYIVGVNNASFEVAMGEILVVMGLSGSGKSTLLRCISRLTDATSGKIYIDGPKINIVADLLNKKIIYKENGNKIIKKWSIDNDHLNYVKQIKTILQKKNEVNSKFYEGLKLMKLINTIRSFT